MNILLIGGTGFLGSHLVKRLIDRRHEVTIISRNPYHDMLFDKSRVRFIKGDILQADKIEIPGRVDVLVYTAMIPFKPGRISDKKFKELERITGQYLNNTIELAKRLTCPLILTSGASFDTKGNEIADESWPIARKGMAALGRCYDEMIDIIKRDSSIPLIEMLPAQIYGNGGMFGKVINMAKNGRIVILGGGSNFLPRIHVNDCADAYVLAIEKLPVGKRFIISDNENVRVKDFMLHLAKAFGARKIINIPNPLLRVVTGKHIFNTLTMNTKVSNDLIKRELGWTPNYPSYREGIKSLLE
ncbi:MAG: NAD(P)-dependent oxidoreductase [Bacteroidales bacterium]|jgi:nucleoside-diphosphate-sugar epimerase|nr:NAD(P)-dependent oxidoreductase [Bacteroidales bacterium]MDD3093768.1 NAD(P)-dependent oxidoreductase [Clostridia bacterium]